MLNEPPQQQSIYEGKAQIGFASGAYANMDNQYGTEEKIGLAQPSQSGLQSLAVQPGSFSRPSRQFQQHGLSTDCPCNPSSIPFSDVISKRHPVHKESQALIDRMLQFTSSSSEPQPAENDTLQLPNIHQHLPPGTDPDAADALSALYRTHCISAIDAFRYCKEKNLMRQFTALAGTLTVPVHKLFVQPCLVNWIEQCDWLMYQKMLAFVAPLTTQVVPDPVLNAFASISRGLVPHIRTTLKSHPEHVSRARLVPATIFSHLLRRFLDVNQAANAAAAWLCHSDNRAKMWEEYDALIDAEEIAARAKIPRCSIDASIGIITHGAKALLMPLATMGLGVEGLYDSEVNENHHENDDEELSLGVGLPALSLPSIQDNPFPDRWTAFLQQLPDLFPNHPAQCVLDKVENSWSAILHRLTLGGAQSFSAWWMAKVFFVEMISWQAEKEGFLQSSPPMLRNSQAPLLRTSGETARRGDGLQAASSDEFATVTAGDVTQGHTHPSTTINGDSGGPNTLASFAQQTPNGGCHARSTHFGINGNDDSAIDLGDDSILQGAHGSASGANTPSTGLAKYKDMITSDPIDADGDVVVA
ncbi:hypothetical protein KEM56_000054 [Ascosphaera pollenicola]|nr:hypothetical protein KEM56_000054 [Ascosphaera pollenicola]